MLITLSKKSSPSIFSHFTSLFNLALFKIKELIGSNVWLIKDDFPEPDTPVTQVNKPIGISTDMFLRLFS